MRSRDRRRHGPEAEKEDDDPETHGPSVDDDAKETRKVERSPDQLVRLACIVRDVGRLSDGTCASAPQEKTFRDDVRRVETAYAKGDDVVESG